MAVPKRRHSQTKRGTRRSHHALSKQKLSPCPKCKNPIPSHTACPTCGTYKGREVIDVTRKLERARKQQEQS